MVHIYKEAMSSESREGCDTNALSLGEYFAVVDKMSLIEINMLRKDEILATYSTHTAREIETMTQMNNDHYVMLYVFYDTLEQKIVKIIRLHDKTFKYIERPHTPNAALSRLHRNNINLKDLVKERNGPANNYLCKLNMNFNMIRFSNDNLSGTYLNRFDYNVTAQETQTMREWGRFYQYSVTCQNVKNPDHKFTVKLTDMACHHKTSRGRIKFIFHPFEPLIITTQRFFRFDKTNVHLYARTRKLD